MRLALAGFAVMLAACASQPDIATPVPTSQDLVIPTAVANGRVEVLVKRAYVAGQTVRATIRLVPETGTLSGPVDPFIQASGFHGTATVRRLSLPRVTATPASIATVEVSWDMRDDAGTVVGPDDYSLVFRVVDHSGRETSVGGTLQVR